MSENLPKLRSGLDMMPSPIDDAPGLILRDVFQYTPAVLLIPPVWAHALVLLDGGHTERDLQSTLTRMNGGTLVRGEDVRRFVDTLRTHGFLETPEFHQLRDTRHEEFRRAAERLPAHAGSAYPADSEELRRQLREDFRIVSEPRSARPILGVAAPHVSPFGGVESYGAAYRQLGADLGNRTFVILGTSHYGVPEKFGLTRKSYRTPLGSAEVDLELVDRLSRNAAEAVIMEDYCHSIEHSIEFQVVFLQQTVGANIRILPVLCGPLFESFGSGLQPDANPGVARFADALAAIADSESDRLFWVLGVDMAHIGTRYGDGVGVTAGQGRMDEVSARDNARIDRICAGDTEGFVRLVQAKAEDDLKWCGYSPFYLFLRVMSQVRPKLRGRVLHYDQWNIDTESVVSFAAMEFYDTRT
jgi:AmmeMemoRadiSam system protein B